MLHDVMPFFLVAPTCYVAPLLLLLLSLLCHGWLWFLFYDEKTAVNGSPYSVGMHRPATRGNIYSGNRLCSEHRHTIYTA